MYFSASIWIFLTGYFSRSLYAKQEICMKGIIHTPYDDVDKICCKGEIRSRVRHQACCGFKTLYFTTESICCGGNVEDRFVPPNGSWQRNCSSNDEQCREQTCCGSRRVDLEDTMCCNDKTMYLNHSQKIERDFLRCCGGEIINTLRYFCCNNTKYQRHQHLSCCDGQVYDTAAENCLTSYSPQRVVRKYDNYCGNIKYNVREQSCCSGKLHNMPEMDPGNPSQRNPKFHCCDDIAYDNTTQKCCRESHTGFPTHMIPRQTNIYCCGKGYYNASHQDCYLGHILEKSGKKRCGYGYVDDVTKKCCADTIYDPDTEECCTGSQSNVIKKGQTCCNGEGIGENSLCCDSFIPVLKKKPEDDECCYNYETHNAETYCQRMNERCENGEVIIVPDGAEACGIFNYYYPATQICCGERVHNISSGFDGCCDDKPYQSKTQQCCNEEISDISVEQGSCCSKDFKVYRNDDARNPCKNVCGNQVYDDTTQLCCQGVLHDLNDDLECCGTSTINYYTFGCCGGQFPYPRFGNIRCCQDRDLYNKKHSKCKNGKVIARDQSATNIFDVQRLCIPSTLKYFDGGFKYACRSQNVVKAKVARILMEKKRIPNVTHIQLSLSNVTGLNRGENFTLWQGQDNITMDIEIPWSDFKCRKRYISKYCKVIIFFNGRVINGNIKINHKAKFFMVGHTHRWEKLVTKQISYEFCKTKHGVR